MKGNNKTVILFNQDNYWRFNLMPQFGSDFVFSNFDDIIDFLAREDAV